MMIQDFRKRFWISLILTIPVLIFAPMIQTLLHLNLRFEGYFFLLFGLSTVLFFYGGFPFLKGLTKELKLKKPGMMTLIAVAITTAYIYSSAVVFGLEGKTFFWELATLIDVMLLGHWIEMKSIVGASKSLEKLASLMPDTAHLVESNQTRVIPVKDLEIGQTIMIKPGEKVPADGKIIEGKSQFNESLITGESQMVKKTKDDEVIGGSVNGGGSVKIKISGTGEDSYLSKVISLVRNAQEQKSKSQRLADKAAFWLTIIALSLGIGTFISWMIIGNDLAFGLERMVTVMVICCPHALGLAIPLVAANSTSIAAQNGFIIRNRTAFENARKITTVVFDKTGTLTKGSHEVTQIHVLSENLTNKKLIQLAASVESRSEHHIAKGILSKNQEFNSKLLAVENFQSTSGVGVSGIVNDQKIQIGGSNMLDQIGVRAPEKIDLKSGESILFILINEKIAGYICIADQLRDSSFKAINYLKNNKIKIQMLTGDSYNSALAVAEQLKLDDFASEVLPDQKLEHIQALQKNGEFVAMTGDGVNDAPALAQSDIGIAIGSGTDVAAETADILLVNNDPYDLSKLILFGKKTYQKIVQNLIWATGYNIVALPLATGFIPGLMISPALGAALMSISTIVCAINAQVLKYQLH